MSDELERRLKEIADHKWLSVQLGHPRAMALAKACLAYRKTIKNGDLYPALSLYDTDKALLESLKDEQP